MSEREYFSVRYLIPGSTFVLLVVAYYIVPLFRLTSSQQNSAIFGAILALLGSPTIGFLVSQLWWWWFQHTLGPYKMSGVEPLAEKILKTEREEDKKNALIVHDYVLHSELHSKKELEGLSKYAFRRYDNYVLLSCTEWSLYFGVVLGLLSRLATAYFLIKVSFLSFETIEVWLWIIIPIIAVIMILAIRNGKKWLRREHEEIHIAVIKKIIKDPKFDVERLKAIFPREYFKDPTKESERESI
jgi:hypothetical protein